MYDTTTATGQAAEAARVEWREADAAWRSAKAGPEAWAAYRRYVETGKAWALASKAAGETAKARLAEIAAAYEAGTEAGR